MRPKKQNQRILMVALFGSLLVIGTIFLFSALRNNTQYFYNPSEVLSRDFSPKSKTFRIGGLVLPGSVKKGAGVTTYFDISDFNPQTDGSDVDGSDVDGSDADSPDYEAKIAVVYEDVLPDMFAEGEGVVVKGRLTSDGEFIAEDVLAKHDENYQPQK